MFPDGYEVMLENKKAGIFPAFFMLFQDVL